MVAVIRQFHDGMRACVRADVGEYQEKLEFNLELRQGYVLSPLLFNFFLAAVLQIVLYLVGLSEDEDTTANLVHVEDGGAGRRNEPIQPVRRAVLGGLHADGTGVVSQSPVGLAKVMAVTVKVFEAAGLVVSEKTNGDHATVDTASSTSKWTFSYRSSRSEVQTDESVYLSRWRCQRSCRTHARDRRKGSAALVCFKKYTQQLSN